MPSFALWQRFQQYFLYLYYRDPEDVFHVLRHPASNDSRIQMTPGEATVDDKFSLEK
jgi:hypothetical protein